MRRRQTLASDVLSASVRIVSDEVWRPSEERASSTMLGGFSFTQLARAELLEEGARGGLARADSLFRVDRAPFCPEVF